jgi:hypothetical protein
MSRQVDVSDPSVLSEDELRYAMDRNMISEDVFLAEIEKFERGEEDGSEMDYSKMKGDELKAELSRRGIDPSEFKTKAEVIAALEADDEAKG